MYDWLLFLHVLSAFLLIGAMTFFWAILLATRPSAPLFGGSTSLALSRPAAIAVVLGISGTLVFGVWLAIYMDEYALWDGWILASLLLWAIGSAAGGRSGKELTPVGDEFPTAEARRRGTILHAISSVASLVILILMIWKPGA